MGKSDKLKRLLNSALAVDSIHRPGDWKRVEDATPEERARTERWLTFWRALRQRRAAALVSTSGKSKEEIVRDMAAAMRRAGLLAE